MKYILAVLMFAGLLIIAAFAGVLAGAFAGWVIGLYFSDTILGTLRCFGVHTVSLELWELGATLGFIGGFFRASLTAK